MSLSVTNRVNYKQNTLKSVVLHSGEEEGLNVNDTTLGGIFHDNAFSWLSCGSRLEVFNTRNGDKAGSWTFGSDLKDLNTEIVCVEEIQRRNGRLPLLAVGVNFTSSGMICIFNFTGSKVIRAIKTNEKLSSLHVINDGCDIFTLPGPLRNFDGVLAVGTFGGAVYLIDICRQICEEALTIAGLHEVTDESNPCQFFNITVKDINKIEQEKELALRNNQTLAIHLNAVFDNPSEHFVLKGPKGGIRSLVNREEVAVSALYYCSQLGSLLIGFNFGAFQLFDLMKLNLVYTSPICDSNIPIVNFVIQEPADDPRAYCYIWAIHSSQEVKPTRLPLAAMYTFSYESKEYHEGYGFLYQDFNAASIHFQTKLEVPANFKTSRRVVGGYCINVNSISKGPIAKEGSHLVSNEDHLSLCLIAWNVCYSNDEIDTFLSVFDLNQWYKEQMPSAFYSHLSSNYMLQIKLNDLISSATNKSDAILNFSVYKNSFLMFKRAQRLEEHFCPNSISFRFCCIREHDCVFLRNYGVQKALLGEIQSAGPLCLVEPAKIYQEIVAVGLVPLFIDLPTNAPISTNQQREIILNAALENLLIGWLCNCASEWSNGSFSSAGCSLNVLTNWIFQRAKVLKTNCDSFCRSLFDYSGIRLDNNTFSLLNCCTRQLNYLCSLLNFITGKLSEFVSNLDVIIEQYQTLQNIVHYYDVLKWFLNVGLLPECSLEAYPRTDDHDRVNAPYPAEALINFYNERRGLLRASNKGQFKTSESVLFIDQLIEQKSSRNELQVQWRNDSGNGLYPPPSLQALLRTYLTHDMDLTSKHSIVTYLFLDLVTILNQEQYKTIVTYLLKFPVVFKISMSLVKIIQGFWQMDHGDYNTAMGLLLDPAIHNKDLDLWHHKVVLRTLMLENQYNFALLYIKIKQPAFVDDEDILAVISLYVRNNMVDEAFYYERHFSGREREEKFLNHLFNECSKNDKLKPIIYRSLTSREENFFLRYLINCKNSMAQDLHVYYHIIRGHYLEAFEAHELSGPNQIDNLGLLGKQISSTRERIMSMLSEIMPELTRNLINLCRKEKNNAWQKVSRPTPMSVFVQNKQTNIHYKSTLIGAALTTAKETFNNTTVTNSRIDTESTPFLRTPKVQRRLENTPNVVISKSLLSGDYSIDREPGSKRLKMSLGENGASLALSITHNLETPIVKRKVSRRSTDEVNKPPVLTPHSILKVKSLPRHSSSKDELDDSLEMLGQLPYTPISPRKNALKLSPRKALGKSPSVRFEGFQNSSSSSLETTRVSSIQPPSNELKANESSDEEFYSPPNSPDLKEDDAGQVEEKQETHEVEVTEQLNMEKEDHLPLSPGRPIPSTPKARKSYRRSLTPVRSSPRLSAAKRIESSSSLLEEDISRKSSTFTPDESIHVSSESNILVGEKLIMANEHSKSPSISAKLRPRRSLCRKVLESNTLKDLTSSFVSPSLNQSEQKKFSQISEEKETLKSTMQYEDGTQTQKTTVLRRQTELHSSMNTWVPSIQTEISRENLTALSFTTNNDSENSSLDISESEDNILKLSDSMYKFVHRPLDESAGEKMELDEDNSIVGDSVVQLEFEEQVGFEKDDDDKKDQDEEQNEKLEEKERYEEKHCVELNEIIENENLSVKNDLSDEFDDSIVKQEDIEVNQDAKSLNQNDKSHSITEERVQQKKLTCDDDEFTNSQDSSISLQNRFIDPEINTFEVSEVLNFNDGFLIEKHDMLEESEYCNDQNTLENVLEENILLSGTVERNIINDYSTEDSRETFNLEEKDGTVITIDSSSDEKEEYDEKGSYHSSQVDRESPTSYVERLYETDISSSASSVISEHHEVRSNVGFCASDATSIASEKSRSLLSDLSDNNEKKSGSSSVEYYDNPLDKEPKLFDDFSTSSLVIDCPSEEIIQSELVETNAQTKEWRKSEGLFHGYILSSDITNEISDETEVIESCNVASSQDAENIPKIYISEEESTISKPQLEINSKSSEVNKITDEQSVIVKPTNETLDNQDSSNSSSKMVSQSLENKSELSDRHIQFKEAIKPTVEEESSQRRIVTRRLSKSLIDCDQPVEDKPLPRSPSRRKSLANDSGTPETRIRTRRQSFDEESTSKSRTPKKSSDTGNTLVTKSEARPSSRAVSVPRSLEIAPLLNIEEEFPATSSTLVQSIINDFSEGRRVTRNQMDNLKKTIAEITEKNVAENSPNKAVPQRRKRSTSLQPDVKDIQTQKSVNSDVKLSSRASSVPPLLSIAEEETVESSAIKDGKKEYVEKQNSASCSNNGEPNLDKLDDYQNDKTSTSLPKRSSQRLRSRSQSFDSVDIPERPRSKSSILSSIAEEQGESLETTQGENTGGNKIIGQTVQKQRNKRNRRTSDQDETPDDKLSATVELPKAARRLRSNSQTSEHEEFLDSASKRNTRSSSAPPLPLVTKTEANKKQKKRELKVVLERKSFESKIDETSVSSKKPARRLVRGKSLQTVGLEELNVETKKEKRNVSSIEQDCSSENVPSKRTRRNSAQK